MSSLTQEQLERFTTLFSALDQSTEERDKHRQKILHSRKRIVYNDDNKIAKAFQTLVQEFKSKKLNYVDLDEYNYEVQKTELTESEFSNLCTFTNFYASRVQEQEEDTDISVVVESEGILLEFRMDFTPTMPQYVQVVTGDKFKEKAVTFEQMLKELPTKYPEREHWSVEEMF